MYTLPIAALLPTETLIVSLMPGWNSLDSVSAIAHTFQLAAIVFFALALIIELFSMFVQKYHNFMQWVGIFFFFLCAGAEFVAYKYDVRREGLVDSQHQAELAAQKQQADDLRQQLQKSQQATAQSSKDSQDARRQAEQSAKDAEAAKRQAAEIKAANQPRRLSDSQKENLRNYLRGQPTDSVLIFVDVAAVDGSDYANDFASTFRAAGWKVDVRHGLSVPTGDAPSDRGLHIIVKEPQPPYPPAAVALLNAIHDSKIDFAFQYNPAMSDQVVQINISPK